MGVYTFGFISVNYDPRECVVLSCPTDDRYFIICIFNFFFFMSVFCFLLRNSSDHSGLSRFYSFSRRRRLYTFSRYLRIPVGLRKRTLWFRPNIILVIKTPSIIAIRLVKHSFKIIGFQYLLRPTSGAVYIGEKVLAKKSTVRA